ncbi:MAG: hypothetical protein FJ358_05965 [Thaumarchaeota archaeon]|nr:hypothetical protein [Nitrososphaerota archaeon]
MQTNSKLAASIIVTTLVVSLVWYAAIPTLTPKSAQEVPVPGPEQIRMIKIGGTLPLSGQFSPVAGTFNKLYGAWADQINARGGLYVAEYNKRLPVQVIVYDDQSDAATATRLYEKLISEDKVDILIGPYSSTLTVPLVAVATRNSIPLVATSAGAPPIFNQGSDWVFVGIDLITNWPKTYFDMVRAKGLAKTIGFVATDEPFGQGILAGGKTFAPSAGLTTVSENIVPVGTKDFTATIAKLKGTNPDIVFVAALAPDAATFVKQAKEQGLKPREFHVPQLVKGFIESVGIDSANYVTGEWYWTEDIPLGGVWGKELFTSAMAKAGIANVDYPWAAVHYYGLEIIGAAIERTGTLDKVKLRDGLKNLSIPTISGEVHFKSFGNFKGVGTLVPFPVQMQNGRVVVVWPAEIKKSDYVYPAP